MEKFGLDVHGVIDRMPVVFSRLTKRLIESGHEVHVITGSQITNILLGELQEFQIHYTHLFSVSDYLIKGGAEVRWSDPENPWFDGELWDKAKADYCKREGILLHIDDSKVYGQYFEGTVYMRLV